MDKRGHGIPLRRSAFRNSLMSSENIGGNDEIVKYSLDTERAIISTHQNSFSLILSYFRL